MTFVLMQNARLPKYRPLSSPLRSGISSCNFLYLLKMYLLNIRNLFWAMYSLPLWGVLAELHNFIVYRTAMKYLLYSE